MRKMKRRQIKELVQNFRISKCESGKSNPSGLAPETTPKRTSTEAVPGMDREQQQKAFTHPGSLR